MRATSSMAPNTTPTVVAFILLLLFSGQLLAASAINVSSLATAGNGTTASPWTGWDTAIAWVGNQEYRFQGGVYAFSTSPNCLQPGIALIGEAGAILRHTGTGNGVTFDNVNSWTDPGARFENFRIEGNANTTNTLFVRGMRNGVFRNLTIVRGTNGLLSEACVTNTLSDVRAYESVNGIVLAARATNSADVSTTWTINNPVVEWTTGIGIWFKDGVWGNTIINGTSESNQGKGAVIQGPWNTIINTDFEANGGNDIELHHNRNTLINVISEKKLAVLAGQGNRIQGGQYKDVYIEGIVDFTFLEGVHYKGVLTDYSTSTIKLGNQGELDGDFHFESFLGHVVERMSQLDSGTPFINTDASRFSKFWLVAFMNFTLSNPTFGINGQSVTWRIQQDNTGSRLISFGSKFRKKGATFPVLQTAPLAFDYITATYNSAADTWDIQ